VAAVTVPPVIVKLADVAPAGTVTVEGTAAADVFELTSDTDTPPVPAGAVSVTVPVPEAPLARVVGLTERPDRVTGCGFTVSVNDRSTPP
jgi:hypothetical protein